MGEHKREIPREMHAVFLYPLPQTARDNSQRTGLFWNTIPLWLLVQTQTKYALYKYARLLSHIRGYYTHADIKTHGHRGTKTFSLSPPPACQDLPCSGLLVTMMTSSLFWVSKSCRLREALVTTTPEPSCTLTESSTIFGGSSFCRCTDPKGTQSKKGNGQGEKTAAHPNEIQATKWQYRCWYPLIGYTSLSKSIQHHGCF